MHAVQSHEDNPAIVRAIADYQLRRQGKRGSPLAINRMILIWLVQLAEARLVANPRYVTLSRNLAGWVLQRINGENPDNDVWMSDWSAAKDLHWKTVYGAMIEYDETEMAEAFRAIPNEFFRIAWGAEDPDGHRVNLQTRAAALN